MFTNTQYYFNKFKFTKLDFFFLKWKHLISYSYEINATTQITAKQIPLDLAWCTTIHKSQGQSLDYIQINIGHNIFECGQTYVALSRVRSLEGLFIEEFDESKIRVNPVVAKYFNE